MPRNESARDLLSRKTGYVVVRAHLPDAKSDDDFMLPGFKGLFQLNSFGCGFTVALMIVRYYEPDADVDKLWNLIRPHSDNGVTPERLQKALKHYGIKSEYHTDLTFGRIADAITDGNPIATLVKSSMVDTDHWIALRGVGVKPDRVFPAGMDVLHNRPMTWSKFEREWSIDGYGFICSRKA